jgi:Ca-activated chloride channel family protein
LPKFWSNADCFDAKPQAKRGHDLEEKVGDRVNAMRHWFANPEILFSLALLPALALLTSIDAKRRRRVLAGIGGLPALTTARSGFRFVRGVCLLTGLVALVTAAAGPRWGRDTSQPVAPGRDLIVVLDCSRSMFAETPSRFERAQTALLDLAAALRRVGGHRVALVTFAARAKLVCPLTHDYDHFRDAVVGIDPQAIDAELGPVSSSPSGTRIGLGLCEAVRAHDARFAGATDILLLSDGDDPAGDGEWQAGVDAARASAVPVFTIGIGDPDSASIIPLDSHAMRYDGKDVRTKLEEAPLRAIAKETGGTFFPARQKSIAAGSLYLNAIAIGSQRDDTEDNLPVNADQSAWFYGTSLAMLAGSILLGGIPPPRIWRQA